MEKAKKFTDNVLEFPFPAKQIHDGIPIGNGLFGALLWGEKRKIKCTINRADFWHHTPGHILDKDASYANIRKWLKAGDEKTLRQVFEGRESKNVSPKDRPTRLPMGRIDFILAENIEKASLDISTGIGTFYRNAKKIFEIFIPRDFPILCLRAFTSLNSIEIVPPGVEKESERLNYRTIKDFYQHFAYKKPRLFTNGWSQDIPEGYSLSVAYNMKKHKNYSNIVVAAQYAQDSGEARRKACEESEKRSYTTLKSSSISWWKNYWKKTAKIHLPDREMEELYYMGIYKLACISVPGTPPSGLQGPWVEDYKLPEWNADFHFNVNIQETYWPVFASNHPECIKPLFKMIRGWENKLKYYAKILAGIDNGYHLPVASDDRATCMGGFWTGFLDHASTAWIAQLMWQYYRYTMDERFLKDTAYPFMKGAMEVYIALVEKRKENYTLEVGVSPEYGGSNFNAYGKNASFQLAAIHFLCRKLIAASTLLKKDKQKRSIWKDIDKKLPMFSLEGNEIAVWEGKVLNESHRHHSHLAGIYPFDILDLKNSVVEKSIDTLIRLGWGNWAGWSFPWAAIIFARLNKGDIAELLLLNYKKFFTTGGRASLHDARFKGLSLLCQRYIMQVEASMGAAAAVCEMLIHTRGEILYVFPAVPEEWEDISIENVLTEGGFLVSARMIKKEIKKIEIKSKHGGLLQMYNPYNNKIERKKMKKGESIVLKN